MKYTAITIGPIYKTLQLARSTKAVWSASYLFSDIMRQLLRYIQQQQSLKVILPFSDNIRGIVRFDVEKNPIPITSDSEYSSPVGLFPDRVLMEGEWKNEDFEKCRRNIMKGLTKTFEHELKDLEKYKETKIEKKIGTFLTHHIQIRRVCVELKENDNHVFELNKFCDTAELFNVANPCANETFLTDYFEKYKTSENKAEYNDRVREKFNEKDNTDNRPFRSTAEIATAEFEAKTFYKEASKTHIIGKKDKTKIETGYDTQNAFYNAIKEKAHNRFKFYHKYMAVVQADGDNVGKLIKQIYESGDSTKIKDFSKSLLAFSVEATKKVSAYHGSAVYAGGDDLLFFAPVAHTNKQGKIKKNILDLITEIDQVFEEHILNNKELKHIINPLEDKPSMSYGINISYYKHPLDQALQNTGHLLFDKAKRGNKNAIALRVTKHSGQTFETIIDKHKIGIIDNINTLFVNLDIDTNFISNFIHKLSPLSTVIYNIGKISGTSSRNLRFDAFFNNYFNEDAHKKSLEQGFLKEVKELITTIYQENALSAVPENDINTLLNSNKKTLIATVFAECPLVDCDKYKTQIEKEVTKEKIAPIIKAIYQDEQHQRNLNILYTMLRFYQFINAKPE